MDRQPDTSKTVSLCRFTLTYEACNDSQQELQDFLRQTRNYAYSLIARESHNGRVDTIAIVRVSPYYAARYNTVMHEYTFNGHRPKLLLYRSVGEWTAIAAHMLESHKDSLEDGELHGLASHDKRRFTTLEILTAPLDRLISEGAIRAKDLPYIIDARDIWRQYEAGELKDEITSHSSHDESHDVRTE